MVVRSGLRKRMGTALAATLFAAGALMVSLAPGAASAGTALTSTSASPQAGQSFSTSFSVNLAPADELNGFDVTLTYDTAVLTPTSVALGSFWNLPLDAGTISTGSAHVAASRLGAAPPAYCTGTCPLFTVNWTATGAGSAQVQAGGLILAGRQAGQSGSLTAVSVALGPVSVAGPTSATATNTPIPPASTAAPATNTATPPTNTTVPAINTPVAPPVTTAPNTPSTAVSNLATPTLAPSSSPVAPATQTPVAAAPVQPAPPGPGGSNPTFAAPAASGSGTTLAPTRTSSNGANVRITPLPPRTGGPEPLAAPGQSPVRVLGLTLMGIAGVVAMVEVVQMRARKRGLRTAIDDFFREEETRGLRGG